jgi:hypothetical protein
MCVTYGAIVLATMWDNCFIENSFVLLKNIKECKLTWTERREKKI